MNVGVILPNWIGDVVMATPTLRALRTLYGGDARLVGVMKPYVREVLAGTGWLDEELPFNRKSADPQLRRRAVVRALRRQTWEAMYVFPNSLSTGLLAWQSGSRRRIGYARNGRGPLLTHKLYPPRDNRKRIPVSAVDYYLDLAYAMGCPPQPRTLELATRETDELETDRIWDALQLNRVRSVIVFNTGGAFGAAKDWPQNHFVELALKIVELPDTAVLVICGPGEKDNAREIERLAGHARVRSMANQDLSLGVAKACVRRCQLMVTTDSGPRHFAAAFNVPVVSLFGPIDPRWSTTYHAREITLSQDVPCGPCGKRICPLEHHRCMRELSATRVFTEVERSLSAYPCFKPLHANESAA